MYRYSTYDIQNLNGAIRMYVKVKVKVKVGGRKRTPRESV